MKAAQALADLTEISVQIEAAVLAEADGAVVASTLGEANERAEELAATARELLAAAEEAVAEQAAEISQLQAVMPEGSVFVVRDERRLVGAVTGPQPTAGLVFYDLRTCLRLLEREEAEEREQAAAKPAPRRKKRKDEEEQQEESEANGGA